ncbi:translation elongation factor 2 (EF-2/EF-G) [Desulfonispora thiosulfatigenes DSM 11270]|uniref:Elongation factor G n=1 Tax=Desulfonispora thiosulfatigenes DSM 11270 TaxID=656914 RepID=A0A1W1VMY5_DESTI|nr:elongation factor G [Desulfonispora thiosulfatigenes]SMB94643.1 translation elongation factor 2 (EF-2/EF-G) [Desulfonispora thiosulfatigenes DSM 11270]
MKWYGSEKIRNIGILGHGGTGKTSLTEAILFATGLTSRIGKVDEGTTVSDYLPEEIKRKISITSSLAPFYWNEYKINLIDTPGYNDFIGEVYSTLEAVDNSLLIVCAFSGAQVQTEIYWKLITEKNKPCTIFINKLDRDNVDFKQLIDNLNDKLDKRIMPIHLPIGSGNEFDGIIDVIGQKAYSFKNGKMIETSIPVELESKAKKHYDALVETVIENDDYLLEKYLEGEDITLLELKESIKKMIKEGSLFPVLIGSVLNNIGIDSLIEFMVEYLPSPLDMAEKNIDDEPLIALVFKTLADPYVGKVNFIRIKTGRLSSNSTVYNATVEEDEKVGNLLLMRGKKQEIIHEARAGDIVAINKLHSTLTGHNLCSKENYICEEIYFPLPTYQVAIIPKYKGDEDKVAIALTKLLEEDPSLKLERNPQTKETIISGLGEMHLEILAERLHTKFGVEILMNTPKVPYRETITKSIKAQGKHKKQSGGAGQYGDVWLVIEPYPDEHFFFKAEVFGGAVPKSYFPAVEKGIKEAMLEGILAKYPVTNISATLVDGSYHPVDSNEISFKIAAKQAFKKAMEKANPVLLEPIMNAQIIAPEQFMGDIIGDLNTKRAKILGMTTEKEQQMIEVNVPLQEMHNYTIDLRSITHGRGSFKISFSHYEIVPQKIAENIIK